MPEGPSIIILKELVQSFKGKKIINVEGNSNLDIHEALFQTITDFKSWGKHFLICFEDFTIRIHFMLFGSYSVNERKNSQPKLSLYFEDGEIHFYACSLLFIGENTTDIYDWSADVMNDSWNPKKAKRKLKQQPATLVSDALLDQNIFAGVGNIIKNEVLFRIMVHPESNTGSLPEKILKQLIEEARTYSFDFLKWKKEDKLKKHWLAYSKKICPRCNIPLAKKNIGKTKRGTSFCVNCQILYK